MKAIKNPCIFSFTRFWQGKRYFIQEETISQNQTRLQKIPLIRSMMIISQPHVYCSVTEDEVSKKALYRLIPSTRIKVSSFAVILLALAHSYILYLPLVVSVQVLRDVLQNHIQPVLSLYRHAMPSPWNCSVYLGRIGLINSILLSYFDTVFHCPLNCHLFKTNTNLWQQKVSPIELLL